VEQELLTIPEHLSSHRVLVGVRFTRSLVLRVWFVDRCLSYWRFCFDHCVVCPLINGFWLPLWYLQTLLTLYFPSKCNMLVLCHIKHPLAHVIVHVVLVLFRITQTYKNLNCVDEVCVYTYHSHNYVQSSHGHMYNYSRISDQYMCRSSSKD
jgi:hypothetical protein